VLGPAVAERRFELAAEHQRVPQHHTALLRASLEERRQARLIGRTGLNLQRPRREPVRLDQPQRCGVERDEGQHDQS
jgi:hypothetical protein